LRKLFLAFSFIFTDGVGKKGRVFAFEPDPTNFALLKKNISINGYKNVILVPKAVAGKTERRKLYLIKDNPGSHRRYDSPQSDRFLEVEAILLDDYFRGNNLRIDFIKMDIEGAEVQALKGLGIIRDCHLIIEVNKESLRDFDLTVSDLMNQIKSCGFTPHIIIDETKKQLIPYSKETFDAMLAIVHYTNLHCIS